ncbi:MAG: nuclear transport factor 2 family protein [Chloroflexota bacterium]|nr:nuclear transport factor 2 family protein [Chloroflexota bacterium]
MTDTAALRDWLDRYERAWRSNDSADIAELFTADAVYRWRPWDSPDVRADGRDAIVKEWLDGPDDPGSWTLECEPLAVNGDLGIARCVTRYRATDERPAPTVYHNIWLVELTDDGRCRDYTELYMEEPAGTVEG